MAAWSITRFKVLPDFKIEVSFSDGTSGIADLGPRLSQGPLGDGLDPLCDTETFSKVYLEHGALTWPGSAASREAVPTARTRKRHQCSRV